MDIFFTEKIIIFPNC